jgi:LacI family sucrose operon transcriptional repressor
LGVTGKDIAVGVMRKKGFQRAIDEKSDCEVRYYETSFSITDALINVPSIIEEFTPSIIVCATDNIAIGALKAAYLRGLKVPEDLSITGFGGYEVTEMITTAKFYYKEAGQMAAKSIVKLVNGEELPKLSLSKYKIIERESVDNRLLHRL